MLKIEVIVLLWQVSDLVSKKCSCFKIDFCGCFGMV